MTMKIFKDLLVLGVILALLFLLGLPYIDLVISLVVILLYTYKGKGIKSELRLNWPDNPIKTIVTALGLALLTVGLSYFVFLPVIEMLTKSQLQLGMFGQLKGNTSLLLISISLGWIVGGFIEELIFRAFLIGRLFDFVSSKWLIFIKAAFSTILFGYLHTYQGPSGQILTGIVGLILATIFLVHKKNIWLNIFTHGFINTISMLFLWFDIIKPS